MEKKKHLLDWLQKHDLISINRLENRLKIPQRIVQKALSGLQELSDKHVPVLEKELKKYGYKPIQEPV